MTRVEGERFHHSLRPTHHSLWSKLLVPAAKHQLWPRAGCQAAPGRAGPEEQAKHPAATEKPRGPLWQKEASEDAQGQAAGRIRKSLKRGRRKHHLVLPVQPPIFLRGEPQLPGSLSMKLSTADSSPSQDQGVCM